MSDGSIICKFQLRVGNDGFQAEVPVPTASVPLVQILPLLLSLDSAVVDIAEKRSKADGKRISCQAGCGACCRQPVPISESEALWLAGVVNDLEPAHRDRVLARFAEVRRQLEARGLWEGAVEFDELDGEMGRHRLGIAYLAAQLPCPFLEDESCSIHQVRPMACREYLVTSPAANCATPSPETIKAVPLPLKPSVALYRFEDGQGAAPGRFLLLTAALEWVARHAQAPRPALPGPVWLENFLKLLAGEQNRTPA